MKEYSILELYTNNLREKGWLFGRILLGKATHKLYKFSSVYYIWEEK